LKRRSLQRLNPCSVRGANLTMRNSPARGELDNLLSEERVSLEAKKFAVLAR
jgi:hypothetical protein